ncbi:MAG: hypothetical protein IT285_03290 [Bdellovibrionales bacterium]|nr:hypothetical protein [Bdellovibrionales bacterium]
MKSSFQGAAIGAACVVATFLLALPASGRGPKDAGSLVSGGLDRWAAKPETQDSKDHKKGVASGEYKNRRTLPLGKKVSARHCLANRSACMCPPGSTRREFWETDAYDTPVHRKLMCVSETSGAGGPKCIVGEELLEKKVEYSGLVTYYCKKIEY